MMKRPAPYLLFSLAAFVALTTCLFIVNRSRRRAHVPEMMFTLPLYEIVKVSGKRKLVVRPQYVIFKHNSNDFMLCNFADHWYECRLQSRQLQPISVPFHHLWDKAISKDDRTFYSWSEGKLEVWDLKTKKYYKKTLIKSAQGRQRWEGKISPDGKVALSIEEVFKNYRWQDKSLSLVRIPDGKRLWTHKITPKAKGLVPAIGNAIFSVDGTQLLYEKQDFYAPVKTGSGWSYKLHDLTFELRNVIDGKLLCSFRSDDLHDPKSATKMWFSGGYNLSLSPDKHLIALAYDEKTFIVSAQSGRLLDIVPRAMEQNPHRYSAPVQFSPNGKQLAVCQGDVIAIWDTQTWKRLQIFYANSDFLAFSPDSQYLATNNAHDAGRLYIWEVGSLN